MFGDQALIDRVDVGPALFAPGRHPVGHGTAPGCGVLHHGMPIAQVFGKTDHVGLCQHAIHVFQIVKIGGVGGHRVVAIKAVFYQQLPVGLDGVFLAPADHFLPGFGLVCDQVKVLDCTGQILKQRHRCDIKTYKPQAPVLLQARRRHQVGAAAVGEAFGVGLYARQVAQFAVRAKHPAVVAAGEVLGRAAGLAANRGTPVRACVQERMKLALGVAVEDQVAATHRAGHKRARPGQLGGMANIQPALVENLRPFGLENAGVDEGLACHAEQAGIRINMQQIGVLARA